VEDSWQLSRHTPLSSGGLAGMPPKKAGGAEPQGKGKAGADKPKDPKVEAEEQAALLKAIKGLTKERERQSENVLLKRLKAKDRKVVRTKKVVKFSVEQLPAATAAATKIQAWARMLVIWLPARRLRTSIVGSIKERANRLLQPTAGKSADVDELPAPVLGVVDAGPSPEELQANAVLRQLPAHQSAVKLAKNVKTAKFQHAALHLQAHVRAYGARSQLFDLRHAAATLLPRMRAILPRSEWGSRLAEIVLGKCVLRTLCQPAFREQRDAISLLQARCRRCVREVISDQKRRVHQATFKRAYVNHKMWLMREIWTRRDAIIEIQSQIRRAIANDDYIERILLAREANRARRTRRECGVLLTSRCRMALDHCEMHRHVGKYNLLRRQVRTRIDEARYHELVQAAVTLQTHLRATASQLKQRLSLRLPLKRHTQYYPDSIQMATVLQAACRRWCMESMGQPSQVEQHPLTGGPRIKLCMDQARDAAVELQLHVRRLVANNIDERLEPRGYARVLTAAELLHAQIRRVRVRTLIKDLMRMYGIMTLQAIVRRNAAHGAYGGQLLAHGRLVYACRRSLVTRWYSRSLWAQRKLQAYAKMTTTAPPDLKFSQMPTRELAKILQARVRGALARYVLVREWDSTLTLQTLMRCRLRRMLYLQCKTWSKKATSGAQNDIHKFFGSLSSTATKGTHMWRTRRYVERTKERGPLWKTAEFAATADAAKDLNEIKAVAAVRYVTTEAKRHDMQAMQIQETIENRVHTETVRQRNGCLFNMQIPSGSRRIVNQGRIVQSLSCTQFILDPLTSSELENEYRHFFLENNGIQRRIIKYTPDHIATVLPPFDIRPVVNTMYYVVDLEPTPIEPNLVRIRRERQRRAATCLQYACKFYTAKKLYRERKFAGQFCLMSMLSAVLSSILSVFMWLTRCYASGQNSDSLPAVQPKTLNARRTRMRPSNARTRQSSRLLGRRC